MTNKKHLPIHDFKGIGFSKIGHFKEVRSKIKELERLNLKLAHRGNRLEAIFNSMSDGLMILDRDLNIVFTNKIQKSMFSELSGVGQKCYQVIRRKESICRDCPALLTLQRQETLRGETLVKAGASRGRYFEWATSPIPDAFGNVEEIILIMRDITERKEYEYKLMQADRMAAIGFLAAGIAHEINNPLTSIAGFSEGLLNRLRKDADLKEDKRLASFWDYLEIINNEAYRCKEIICNLQEFSRNTSDDFQTLQIDRIIQDTVRLFRQHAKDNNIRITVGNHLSMGFNRIIGKESQLKHLFLNLFNNAFQSMEDGGDLSVVARNEGNLVEILISDTGEGDPRQSSGNIFDPASVKQSLELVTAINLSICYNIVQHHKGEIRYRCANGGGSTFTLRLPAVLPSGSGQ